MSEEREISIQPDFTIYGDGTPMCKNHSFHDSITPDNEEKIIFFQKFKNYHKVNCLTCSHYHQNHCYYSKQQIETFEFQRKTSHLHCIYCGDKIRNLFSILYSDYSIKQYSKMANHSYIIKIPFICCSCYTGLKNKGLLETLKFKKKHLRSEIFQNVGAYVFFGYLFLMFWGGGRDPLKLYEILGIGIVTLSITFRMYLNIRHLMRFKKGLKMAEQQSL